MPSKRHRDAPICGQEEMAQSRDELGKGAREQRQELTEALKTFGDSVVERMMDVASMQKGQLRLSPVSLLLLPRRAVSGWMESVRSPPLEPNNCGKKL